MEKRRSLLKQWGYLNTKFNIIYEMHFKNKASQNWESNLFS